MKKLQTVLLLLGIFFLVFISRLLISFHYDEFSYDSYFALRQIEQISSSGLPIFNDDLSYSGRSQLFPPIFYYLVSVFSFFGTKFAAKIVPNIFFSLIIIPTYLITHHITKRRVVGLISSLFAGFIPVTFSFINDISEYSLVLFLFLFLLYSLFPFKIATCMLS